MTYVKINGTMYPAEISGLKNDYNWDDRASKTVRLGMPAAEAKELFVDDIVWSIVEDGIDEHGDGTQFEYECSDYCKAGDVIDHRDGTVSCKMGKYTDGELLAIITGGANK